MSKTSGLIISIIVVIGVGTFVFLRGVASQANQRASLYETSIADGTEPSSAAVTFRDLGYGQCLGIDAGGRPAIGSLARKFLSFSKECMIIPDASLPPFGGTDDYDSDRFWFGSLFGSVCYGVVRDNVGTAVSLFRDSIRTRSGECFK